MYVVLQILLCEPMYSSIYKSMITQWYPSRLWNQIDGKIDGNNVRFYVSLDAKHVLSAHFEPYEHDAIRIQFVDERSQGAQKQFYPIWMGITSHVTVVFHLHQV